MSPFIKAVLDHTVKPLVDSLIVEAKANKAAAIVRITTAVDSGVDAGEATATELAAQLKTNTFLAYAVQMFAPALITGLKNAVKKGESSIPAYYDAGIAFLEREDAYL